MRHTAPQVLERLRGRRAVIEGRRVVVVEILLDEQLLVLKEEQGSAVVQSNQYGEAARRVSATWTIPLRSSIDRAALHPVLELLLEDGETQTVVDWLTT